MTFWIRNIVIFVFYAVILCKHSKKNNVFLMVAMLHLGFLMAFRGISVGTDTGHYTRAFKLLCSTGSAGTHVMTTAPAFYQYMKLVSKIYPYENGYIIFTSIPTIFCFAYLLKNHAINYFESIFLFCSFYFYFNIMNVARQGLMIGLVMISYCLICKKKKILGWIVFLLSCAVHSAALLFGVYIAANLIKWSRKKLIAAMLTISMVMLFVPVFVQFFVRLYPQYNNLAKRIFTARYTSQGRSAMVYAIYCMVAVAIEWFGVIHDEKKIFLRIGTKALIAESSDINERSDMRQRGYEWMIMVFTSGCLFLFYPTVILFWRMAYTGFLFIILLLPHALSRIKCGRLFCKLLLYIPLFVMMLMQIAGDYSKVRDYTFWWG